MEPTSHFPIAFFTWYSVEHIPQVRTELNGHLWKAIQNYFSELILHSVSADIKMNTKGRVKLHLGNLCCGRQKGQKAPAFMAKLIHTSSGRLPSVDRLFFFYPTCHAMDTISSQIISRSEHFSKHLWHISKAAMKSSLKTLVTTLVLTDNTSYY